MDRIHESVGGSPVCFSSEIKTNCEDNGLMELGQLVVKAGSLKRLE